MTTHDRIYSLLWQYIGTAIFPSIMAELADKLDDLCLEKFQRGQKEGPE